MHKDKTHHKSRSPPAARTHSRQKTHGNFSRGNSPNPSDYKCASIEKEFLQNIHLDMSKASSVIARLRTDKKELKFSLNSITTAYNALKIQNNELSKSLADVTKHCNLLENKIKRMSGAVGVDELKNILNEKEAMIKELQYKNDCLENILEKQGKDSLWKGILKANKNLKDDILTSHSYHTNAWTEENSVIINEIIECGCKMVDDIQKNYEMNRVFGKMAIKRDEFKDLLMTEHFSQAFLGLINFVSELTKTERPKLYLKPNLDIPKQMNAFLSPRYTEPDNLDSRLALLHQQIHKNMESSKKILEGPSRTSGRSLSMSTRSQIREESINEKLEIAEKMLNDSSSSNKIKHEESVLLDFAPCFDSNKENIKPISKDIKASKIPVLKK